LAVGLHLVVVMGRSVLPKSEIPNLVNNERRFPSDPITVGLKYYFSRRAQEELGREMAAQFEMFRSTGLPFSHIDGHLHMHTHPIVFGKALKLGEQYGVRRMRVPEEELRLALRFKREHVFRKTVHWLVFSWLARSMKKHLRAKKFSFVERAYGTLQTGRMNAEYLLYLLHQLRAERNEIHCHPALYKTASLSLSEQSHLAEYEALIDPRVIEFLNTSAIQLINYFGLDLCD
jgi:hopanoid biosynthesis associated protein HpnK